MHYFGCKLQLSTVLNMFMMIHGTFVTVVYALCCDTYLLNNSLFTKILMPLANPGE